MPLFGKRKSKPPVFFGASLDKFEDVPEVVRQICDHIDETSADVEGLFRKAGKDAETTKICKLYETQPVVDLNDPELNDPERISPHTLCNVIKRFFRGLEGGIVSQETIQKLVSIAKEFPNDTDERLQLYCEVLSSLPMTNRITLIYFLDFLHSLTKREEKNKMNAENLAISIVPSLFWVDNKNQAQGGLSPKDAIEKANAIQKGVSDALAQMINYAPKLKRNFGFRFGAPIYDFDDVPGIIRQICDHIVERSIEVKDILTINSKNKAVTEICELYKGQSVVDLTVYRDPFAAPTVLKMFLRELKVSLVNEEATLSIVRIEEEFSKDKDAEKRLQHLSEVLSRLPKKNRRALVYLVEFLNFVNEKKTVNGMTAEAIAASFGGIIFRFRDSKDAYNNGQKIVNAVLAELVENPQIINPERTGAELKQVTHTQAANAAPMQSLQQG